MPGSIQQIIRYWKRNGFAETLLAIRERLWEKRRFRYDYLPPAQEELQKQRDVNFERRIRFSIIVPAYETAEVFLQDLILSVVEQSYTDWELIIADASESRRVEYVVKSFQEQYEGIRYEKLEKNEGISGNTNRALELAEGDYIALLDHDDLLTPDALFLIREEIDRSDEPVLVYTDEDKTDTHLEHYFCPHRKKDFDRELFYTNNYVCHFSVFRGDVIKELKLDPAYDGSQDHELLLRLAEYARKEYPGKEWQKKIRHVPKILYHWRCHEESTAADPAAKNYAYEAGRRAVQASLAREGISAKVLEHKHLGFYRLEYEGGVFSQRPDIAMVAGPVREKGRTVGGAMKADGSLLYGDLPEGFSGPMHIAALQQSVEAADLRNAAVREELIPLYKELTGYEYPFPGDEDEKRLKGKSLKLCKALREKGYTILYDPYFDCAKEKADEA
ncbi:MAG: glycosyltransferase [Lachnospiraceae bacterium]|nr:glycosyltransferase [Lachnospiraceae bacterium]